MITSNQRFSHLPMPNTETSTFIANNERADAMQNKRRKYGVIVVLPAAMLVLASCSSLPTTGIVVEERSVVLTEEGVPGGIAVDTYTITATVDAVDAATRKITLATLDGAKTVLTAGPEVVNFDHIQVGDQVRTVVAEALVVYARERGEPANDGEAAVVALAPVGAKPGVLVVDTVEVTATVEALDLVRRKATLRFPDGVSRTYKVREDVDMTQAKLGDEIVIRATEAMAILVEKP